MRKLAIAMLLAGTIPAAAQDYTISLPGTDLDYIGKVLGKQPFNEVAPIMVKLQKQIDAQNKAREAPQSAPAAKEKP